MEKKGIWYSDYLVTPANYIRLLIDCLVITFFTIIITTFQTIEIMVREQPGKKLKHAKHSLKYDMGTIKTCWKRFKYIQ